MQGTASPLIPLTLVDSYHRTAPSSTGQNPGARVGIVTVLRFNAARKAQLGLGLVLVLVPSIQHGVKGAE